MTKRWRVEWPDGADVLYAWSTGNKSVENGLRREDGCTSMHRKRHQAVRLS